MPHMQPIVLMDGATPAVSITFNPANRDGGTAVFSKTAEPVIPARDQLIFTTTQAKGSSSRNVTVRLSRPVVVEATGTNGVITHQEVRKTLSTATVIVGVTSTVEERRDARVLLANALLSVDAESLIDDAEDYYG